MDGGRDMTKTSAGRRGLLLGALAALASVRAWAQGAKASSAVEFGRQAAKLKPGEWVWAPQIAPDGPVLVYVDLSRQRATVYRNGVRIGVCTVSSGKKGHETPTGVFTILQKDANHHSSLYDNAPMPFQQRLTWDGVALHAGGLPGYPESHGCVHLPYNFARELFGITRIGATVVVAGTAAGPVRATRASVLSPVDAKGKPGAVAPLDANEPFRWTPAKSTQGPLTIVVSKGDQRIVVLRGGVEIGRSRAEIRARDADTHVISYTTGPGGAPGWLYLALPGHPEEGGRPLSQDDLDRVRLPKDFYTQLQAAIAPGATILVTQSSVGGGDMGKRLTILDAIIPKA